MKTNFIIPTKLCEISKKLNIYFVHISTDMLFRGNLNRKYIEKSKLKALNTYSATKIKAERKIRIYKKSLIIRTNFFGFSGKTNMSFSDKILNDHFAKKITYLWEDVYITPVYITFLVKVINQLIRKKITGIFNVSCNECVSKFNFGKKLLSKISKTNYLKSNKFEKKKFTNRPKNMCISNDKIKKTLPNIKKMFSLNYQLNLFKKDFKKLSK